MFVDVLVFYFGYLIKYDLFNLFFRLVGICYVDFIQVIQLLHNPTGTNVDFGTTSAVYWRLLHVFR